MALRGPRGATNHGGRAPIGPRYQTTLRTSLETGAWIVDSAERGGYRSVNDFLCDLVKDARANGAAPTRAAAQESLLTA